MNALQKILRMTTGESDLRSAAEGWTYEDGDVIKQGPIGLSPGVRFPYAHGTPMHAIAAGWRLLAPPTMFTTGDGSDDAPYWTGAEWWFVRDDAPEAL